MSKKRINIIDDSTDDDIDQSQKTTNQEFEQLFEDEAKDDSDDVDAIEDDAINDYYRSDSLSMIDQIMKILSVAIMIVIFKYRDNT
ncbi:hypothetical protein Tco_1580708 [Tanacetum coccineum]